MTEFPVPLDSLIAFVKTRHPGADSLQNLSDAVELADQLDEQSDALIGHFVDQARRSGASWSQIGVSMGVSKQAAQKRFVPRETTDFADFSRFTARCRRTLAAAAVLAGGGELTDMQILAGLLSEPEGVAAQVIHGADITDDRIYGLVGATPPNPATLDSTEEALQKLTFASSARAVLAGALHGALGMRHNYIGTEHVLLGVMHAGGPAAQALGTLGLTYDRVRQDVATALAHIVASRQA